MKTLFPYASVTDSRCGALDGLRLNFEGSSTLLPPPPSFRLWMRVKFSFLRTALDEDARCQTRTTKSRSSLTAPHAAIMKDPSRQITIDLTCLISLPATVVPMLNVREPHNRFQLTRLAPAGLNFLQRHAELWSVSFSVLLKIL